MAERGKKYYQADKFSLQDLPKILIPTRKMGYIIGIFFIASLIIGIFTFPLGAMMSGNTDLKLNFGWPMAFLILDSTNVEKIPIDFFGLIIDLIFYVSVAYIIDVILNYLFAKFNYTFSDEAKYYPKLYKK